MIEFSNSILKDRIEIVNNSTHKLVFRTFLEPGGGQKELHYHTKLNEKFKIIQGSLNIIIKDDKRILNANEEALIPKFTNHLFYNNSNEQVVFDVEIVNPKKMIYGLQIMYGLASSGKINKKGLPKNIIHTAIGLHMMDAYSPKLPYLFQKIGISTIALLGKVIGTEKKLVNTFCN